MVRTNRSLYWAVCLLLIVGCGPALRQPRVHPTGSPRGGGPSGTPPVSDLLDPAALETLDRAARPLPEPYQVGIASYYGKRFHGRRTANGERFNMYELTAAHRALPHGTLLLVTNVKNGRCVQVKVNDRGPYIKGRVLDVSYQAAQELGMVRDGVTRVEIDVLRTPEPDAATRLEPADAFDPCAGSPSAFN
jgi:rare lipoprotein A